MLRERGLSEEGDEAPPVYGLGCRRSIGFDICLSGVTFKAPESFLYSARAAFFWEQRRSILLISSRIFRSFEPAGGSALEEFTRASCAVDKHSAQHLYASPKLLQLS